MSLSGSVSLNVHIERASSLLMFTSALIFEVQIASSSSFSWPGCVCFKYVLCPLNKRRISLPFDLRSRICESSVWDDLRKI